MTAGGGTGEARVDQFLQVKDEVRSAIDEGRPVVALESTIIAHGMPHPENLRTALRLEELARDRGVVPATVAVMGGRLRVGLEPAEIEHLARSREVRKVSRRDLSPALAAGATGATTVSATMAAAHLAGIRVFATGGIGGVHRGGETTFDVSADLTELSHTPVVVISSGAKAILDLPKTLEVLETLGVPVLGFGTREFPSFYSRGSGIQLELTVDSPEEAASVCRAHRALGLEQGILVANPVPEEHEIPRAEMEGYLTAALEQLDRAGVSGGDVTPFLLRRIVELSGGRALETNIRLVESNVALACRIARELAG